MLRWEILILILMSFFQGVVILSVALALLLYVLAMVTSSYRNIYEPSNICLLTVAVVMITAFPFWMYLQDKNDKPALIPNRLWRKAAFTASCLAVFFCWASLNGIEYFTTL